jgi:hypothetical protein
MVALLDGIEKPYSVKIPGIDFTNLLFGRKILK